MTRISKVDFAIFDHLHFLASFESCSVLLIMPKRSHIAVKLARNASRSLYAHFVSSTPLSTQRVFHRLLPKTSLADYPQAMVSHRQRQLLSRSPSLRKCKFCIFKVTLDCFSRPDLTLRLITSAQVNLYNTKTLPVEVRKWIWELFETNMKTL